MAGGPPTIVHEVMSDPDPEKGCRAMAAILKMEKLDVAEIERAARGRAA
jgi:hypothetical protein